MNQKKVKAIRKQLRSKGINSKEKQYTAEAPIPKKMTTGRFNEDGSPEIISYYVTGTIKLRKECGRHVYKLFKKEVISG